MSTQRDLFIQTYMPQAERVAQQLNVPVQGVLNHWGLETGWGKSVIPGTNNLGNIKDFSGGGVGATDNMTKARDNYRQYASPDDFANDYARMIGTNKRYANALNTNSVYDFANGLQRGGYAEDPNFARKVAGMPLNNIPAATAELNALGGLPVSRQAYYPGNANFKAQNVNKIAPEVAAELEQIRQQKMAMLPYALAHSMSSNAGSQNFGQLLTSLAMPAMEGTNLKNGRITPSGQYITDQSDADQWKAYASLLAADQKGPQYDNGGNITRLNGTTSNFGYTPEGDKVVTNQGAPYIVKMSPQGPVYVPYEGQTIDDATFEKNVEAAKGNLTRATQMGNAEQNVKTNQGGFGTVAGAVSKLPSSVRSWVSDKYFTPEEQKARAAVFENATQEIHTLAGASQTPQEASRIERFMPSDFDSAETIQRKLASARSVAQERFGANAAGIQKAAAARSGQVSNTPPVGGGAPESADRKVLNGVSYVKRNGQWYEEK